MEVALLSPTSLRIKSKQAQLVVNPDSKIPKTPADIVLQTKRGGEQKFDKVEGHRLVVKGPGEYEVSGVKISAIALGDELSYNLDVDLVATLCISAALLPKIKDKLKECHLLVLYANEVVEGNVIEDVGARAVVLYGEKAKELAKELGKEEIAAVKKYSTTLEKLPAEMEVVILE